MSLDDFKDNLARGIAGIIIGVPCLILICGVIWVIWTWPYEAIGYGSLAAIVYWTIQRHEAIYD